MVSRDVRVGDGGLLEESTPAGYHLSDPIVLMDLVAREG